MPRKSGSFPKPIANVQKVLAVASGKGGVGKSTIAVNLALALALHQSNSASRRLRVGILDLDIFGPSIPTLMGLQNSDGPTFAGGIRPLVNHGIPTMSMGYLLARDPDSKSNMDTPVVWRGLMVQKAVQQLLFDVDWTNGTGGPGLDVLVVDVPPGTGDVPLSLGQLVTVDGAVIVSTPQDVALSDVRKGIAMFRKVSIPITGVLLNQSHFICPSCDTNHQLFGSPDAFRNTASLLDIEVLGELPLVPGVSSGGDEGVPYALLADERRRHDGLAGSQWMETMAAVAAKIWKSLR